MDKDLFFKEHHEELKTLVNKRRHKWRATSIMEWQDLESVLLTRIYQQLHHYDITKPLDRWVNKLISNAMMNMLRDLVFRDARPCVSGQAPGFSMGSSYGRGCACALANGGCSWTKSGVQDSSCKFYAQWAAKKQSRHAISATLSLENHVDESHSMQDDFFDIAAAKEVIDKNIKRRLTKEEYRIYVYLYVKHMSMDETIKKMGFKKVDKDHPGYKQYMRGYVLVRSASLRAKETVLAIASEQGLIK